jgi:hypothetical protein
MTRHGPLTLRWRKHLPPDVGAAMAYLKNRRPDRWRDTRRIEHTRSPYYDHIESTAELRALLQEQARRLGLIDVTPAPKAEPALSENPQIPKNRNPAYDVPSGTLPSRIREGHLYSCVAAGFAWLPYPQESASQGPDTPSALAVPRG